MVVTKIKLILLAILLISCGTRKVDSSNKQQIKITNEEVKKDTEAETITTQKIEQIADISNINLSIEPIEDKNVKYKNVQDKKCPKEIIYIKDKKGNEVQIPINLGSKINFGTQNKQEEIKAENKQETKEVVTEISKVNNKDISKEKVKKTESVRSAFGWYVVFFGLGFITALGLIQLKNKLWL